MSTKNFSTESFQTSRKFYDDKNYPRGMGRSGDYSITEVKILETYGVALAGISAGTIEPKTEEEKQFKAVCDGSKTAETPIEKAWLKYQTKTLTPKQFHTLFGRSKIESNSDDTETEPDDSLLDIED